MSARCSLLALLLFLGSVLGCCLAGRVPEAVQGLVVRDDHLRGSGGPAAAELPRPHQQHAIPAAVDADRSNVEYVVDYSDEDEDEGDPLMSDDSDDRALEVMTFTTYFPGRRQPCQHHRQHVRPAAARAGAGAAPSAAAQNRIWQRAQQVAARLAAAGAFEAQELIEELEVTLDSMGDAAYDGVLGRGDEQDSDPIDHRWEEFDGGPWSQEAADYIDPSQYPYVSGLDDYEPPSSDGNSDSTGLQEDSGDYDQFPSGLLPAFPAPLPAADGRQQHQHRQQQQQQDTLDIGLLVAAEDNAANNLLLFGVRTPEEVAAAAAAAGPAVHWTSSSSSWASMLEHLTQAPSPSVEAQQAAVVLLVGCTLMMFVVFLSSVADLRAAVAGESEAAAAAAAATAAALSNTRRSGGGAPFVGALRTRKQSAFAGCSAVAAAAAAAAAAAVGAGCAGGVQQAGGAADDLSMPLLLDQEDDVEAALLEPRPAAVLPPALQKFYNPMHYQALPDSD